MLGWVVRVRRRLAESKLRRMLESGGPRRVLFVQYGGIGDVLMLTPAMRAVKGRWPGVSIHLAVAEDRHTRQLFPDRILIDDVIEYKIDVHGRAGLRSTFEYLRRVRANQYDVIFSFGLGWRNVFRTLLSSARVNAGIYWPTSRAGLAYEILYDFPKMRTDGDHHVETALSMAGLLEGARDDLRYQISITPEAAQQARTLLGRVATGRPVIGLHVGCMRAKIESRWPPERFAALAQRLTGTLQAELAIVGGPEDLESVAAFRRAARELGLEQRIVLDATNRVDLQTTAAIVAACDLFISNDSGLAHIAAAAGVPQVVVWGPTHLRARPWRTDGALAIVKRDLACMPCWNGMSVICTNPSRYQCMLDIDVEQVERAVRDLWTFDRSRPSEHRT